VSVAVVHECGRGCVLREGVSWEVASACRLSECELAGVVFLFAQCLCC
jgi:hypothetical protein